MGYYISEYDDGTSVRTIELGKGDIRIGACLNVDEGKAGVAFAELEEPVEIGADILTPEGSTSTSLNCFLQIESTSVASLLVLRTHIDKAIGYLEGMENEQ